MSNDLMENIKWFSNMDDKQDGLTKGEALTLWVLFSVRLFAFLPSLSLSPVLIPSILWQSIFWYEAGSTSLGAVRLFFYHSPSHCQSLHRVWLSQEAGDDDDGEATPRPRKESNQPYLNLATHLISLSFSRVYAHAHPHPTS